MAEKKNAGQAQRRLAGRGTTVPPGLFYESTLAGAHTLPRVLNPVTAVVAARPPQVPTKRQCSQTSFPEPGTQNQLHFLRQSSGSSSTKASTLGPLPSRHL